MRSISRCFALLIVVLCTGCANLVSKESAFPSMYSDNKPASLLVVPAINKTTAADAADYLNVTITQPLADAGYYVIPMPIVTDVFKSQGIVDGAQVTTISPDLFAQNFGVDSVLFVTINEWDKNYYVVGGNVTVGLEYLLVSTATSDVLWSYTGKVVADTSGNANSGNPLADLVASTVATAITTASTRYVDVASMVHNQVLLTMPYGGYHPRSGQDGTSALVDPQKTVGIPAAIQ